MVARDRAVRRMQPCPADHAPSAVGASWSPTATLTVSAEPGAGRKLTGTLSVQTDAGVTVGSGSLIVDTVTQP